MSSDDQPPHAAKPTLLFRALPSPNPLSAADRRALRAFAEQLTTEVAAGHAFLCLVTDDRELQRLNRTFLQHDYPTDVLSFPLASPNGGLGEIAISIERAAAQAAEFGHNLLDELRILMLHGLLHLTGLDHERDRGRMAQAERKWRHHFALPEGLIARSRRTAGAKA
ncbi:MAG TPA: rRNA maturation RNase YbeY [Bryobacteraceae bacterium]|jgi:probable rRNA maturation factor|nr:rRNA maturation RNase YbeY [Bryobacteraceae bacterium]